MKFRDSASQQARELTLVMRGMRRKKNLRGESGVEKLELPEGQEPQSLALQLMLDPAVEYAEPNFVIAKDDVIPDDASFGEQWALNNTGQNGGHYGSDIGVGSAWQTTTGSTGTVVAIIDSGIDFTHADLANNQWTNANPSAHGDVHGWDYVYDSAVIQDEQGHGTAMAGIIAAQGNNSLGISGVMWRASLMSLRVQDNVGNGDVANAVEAIDYQGIGNGQWPAVIGVESRGQRNKPRPRHAAGLSG